MIILTQETVEDLIKSLNQLSDLLKSLSNTEEEPDPTVAPEPTPDPVVVPFPPAHHKGVEVATIAEFNAAVANANKNRTNGIAHINLTQDIAHRGQQVLIQTAKKVTVNGSKFKFHRKQDQYGNHMFHMLGCEDFKFSAVGFDDNNDGKFGKVGNGNTKHMIWVRNSKNIDFDDTVVENAKGYTLYIQDVDGFSFTNSEMLNAGILGLYVGHDNQYSERVVIEDNHFHDNATNAIALLGVAGGTQNIVRNNLFERNHIYGRWAVAPQYGTGFTGGGQLYIAQADNLLVEKNKIYDGKCLNGYHRLNNSKNGDVSGIELSENKSDRVRVKNTIIRYNDIRDNDGHKIAQNVLSILDSTTEIYGNTGTGNGHNDRIVVKEGQAKVS